VSCIAWEELVEYWAGELDQGAIDRIDEHVFGCDACAQQSRAIARIVVALRDQIPPVVSADQVRALVDGGAVIEHNACVAGRVNEVRFPAHADLVIHHLGGLDLGTADGVSVIVRVASSGDVITEEHFVPFDRERGEVLIACQRHFSSFPPDIVFDVHVHGRDTTVASFDVPHLFDG
jgi:putative zinc finger protein